jgi:hypothetical protein
MRILRLSFGLKPWYAMGMAGSYELCECCKVERLTAEKGYRYICGKCIEILKALYKTFPQLRPK